MSVDRASYDQLVSQFGESEAKSMIGNNAVVDGPDSTTVREFKQQTAPKKRLFKPKTATTPVIKSAFGVDHEPVSKGLGDAWKLGSAMRGSRKMTTGVYQSERANGANVGAARETALKVMAPRASELGGKFKAQSTAEKGVSLASTYSRPIGATAAVGAGGVGAYKYGQKRSR